MYFVICIYISLAFVYIGNPHLSVIITAHICAVIKLYRYIAGMQYAVINCKCALAVVRSWRINIVIKTHHTYTWHTHVLFLILMWAPVIGLIANYMGIHRWKLGYNHLGSYNLVSYFKVEMLKIHILGTAIRVIGYSWLNKWDVCVHMDIWTRIN